MNAPTRRVLIVDDEPNIRSALTRSLRKSGYEISTAESAAEALILLKERGADVVISDHLMPGMTGIEFLTIVRDRYPHAVRILLTGHADMATAIRCINDGQIFRFLTKPWDTDSFEYTLHLAFEHLELERQHRRMLSAARRDSDRLAVQS